MGSARGCRIAQEGFDFLQIAEPVHLLGVRAQHTPDLVQGQLGLPLPGPAFAKEFFIKI